MKKWKCFTITPLLFLTCNLVFLTLVQETHSLQKQSLSRQEYDDPKGFFTIFPPSGWLIREYPNDPRGKVSFMHPSIKNLTLRIIAQAADYKDFKELSQNAETVARKIRAKFNGEVTIRSSSLGDAPALKVIITIPDQLKYLQYQFLRGRMYYNLSYSAPLYAYEDFLTEVTYSIETFEPSSRGVSTKDVVQHSISAKVRRATLLIQMGKLELALEAVNEGLGIEPTNSKLIELKKLIQEKRK